MTHRTMLNNAIDCQRNSSKTYVYAERVHTYRKRHTDGKLVALHDKGKE